MKTVLVSGNDTGVGKTRIVAELARRFAHTGQAVQVVKPVETGVAADESGDAQLASADTGARAYRFVALPEPLAPLTAAKRAGRELTFEAIVQSFGDLESCDVRIIEGAGGLAVPLDEGGKDWADLAQALRVDCVVLVVQDRLGAINQARLLEFYARKRELPAVFWLNECAPETAVVKDSNREAFAKFYFPLMAETPYGEGKTRYHREVFA